MVKLGYIITTILYLVLLVITLVQNKKAWINRSFAIFSAGLLLWTVTLYMYIYLDLGDHLLLVGRLNYAVGLFFFFGLPLFFYNFPRETIKFSPLLKKVVFAEVILFSILTTLTPLVDKNEVMTEAGPNVELGEAYWIYMSHVFIYLITTFFLGFKKMNSLQGLEKLKFENAFWVFIIAISILIVSNGILPVFGIQSQFIYSYVWITPIVISCFYSIHRYRFFNLSSITLNIVRKIILLSVFLVIFYLMYQGISMFSLMKSHVFRDIISGLIALGAFVEVSKIFPQFLPSDLRNFKNALRKFRTKIYACTTYKHLQSLLDQTFEMKLNIPNARVFVLRNTKKNIAVPVYVKNQFTKGLTKKKKVLVAEEIFLKNPVSKKRREVELFALKKLDVALCFPLFAEEKLIGIFILGYKEKDASYTKEEIESILECIPNLETTFMNILLQNNFEEEKDMLKFIIREKTEKLKTLVRQQSDFMTLAAHELRTPLSIAIFKLQDVIDTHEEDTEFISDTKTISRALEDLKNLTEKFFEVQQYELGKIQYFSQEIDIAHFLQEITEEFTSLMKEKSYKFSFKDNLKKKQTLSIDVEQIRQVLHNLLGNAMKFTPSGGKINLVLSKEKNHIKICVQDNGNGITDGDKESVFDKFQTTNATMGMGIGLGLYLCKKIIKLHSGKIWAENTPGGGATVCFLIPS